MLDFYKDKKVFITGHTGFKGTWLSRILTHAGAEVIGYSLSPPTNPSLFEQIKIGYNSVRWHKCDIRDRSIIAHSIRMIEPSIVFHMAAQPIVRTSYHEPLTTYETNIMGTVNILEAIRKTPAVRSFVNVTTDKVYENKEWERGYTEDEKLCGHDPYSNSKSCSELVTYGYRNSFFHDKNSTAISTARSGNVIGGGDYAVDRIIPDCIRAVKTETDIIIRNPSSTRPYQHVLECLYGYLLLAEKQYNDKSFEGAYNFGPDDEGCVNNEKLVNLFCDAWGSGASWRVQENSGDAQPLHEATFLKLDCSKAKSVLGWKPRWNIKTAAEKTVEFAKLNTDEDRTACIDRQIQEYFGGSLCLNQ
ncbi:MAG: CDP-glucose 4,6-dehydratase [Chitinispirillales bacterium]|jgi:CDP-glucose 4,6-dehydratase|nr:CDP-glucose 4,6-dehydratase [Chitinispirillales bacterium]